MPKINSPLMIYIVFFTLGPVAQARPIEIRPGPQAVTDTGVENQLRAKISASFSLDVDAGREVLNLTKQSNAQKELVYGDFRDGFQVKDSYSITVGGGPATSFYFNNPTGGFSGLQGYIGLSPSVGKNATSIRIVPDLESVAKLKRFASVPMKAADLNEMKSGDSFTFGTEGGLEFGLTVTDGIFVASVSVAATGEISNYVEKVDATHIYLDLSSTKAKIVEASAGASFATIAASGTKSLSNGLTFEIDLADPDGGKAYEDLVHGNVAAVQQLIAAGRMPSVQAKDRYKIPQVAKYLSFSIGVPTFFEVSWSAGRLREFNDTVHLNDGSSTETTTGVYVEESELHDFFHHHEKIGGFYGVAFDEKTQDGQSETGKFGQFNWSFNSNESSSTELRQAMRALIRRTGLRDLFNLSVPDHADGSNQIALSLDLSDAQTDTLMTLATQGSENLFTGVAAKLHESYFASGDIDGVCPAHDDSTTMAEDCIADLADESQASAQEMFLYLNKMAIARANHQDRQFADAYAKFGEGMIKNQFTFQTILQLVGGGSHVEYDIVGTRISNYHASLATPLMK